MSGLPQRLCCLLIGALCLCGLLASSQAAPALCGPEEQNPQRLAELGLKTYREALALPDAAGRTRALEQALRCFLRCMEVGQKGTAKINHPLALVYEKLGRNVEAVVAFRRFLRDVPETARLPGVTKQVNDKLRLLAPQVAELSIDTVAGLEVRVDRKPVGRAPLDELLVVTPGTHDISAGSPELGTIGTEVRVEGGQVRRVDLTGWRPRSAPLKAPSPAAQPARRAALPSKGAAAEAPSRPLIKRWWLWTAVGVVATGAVVGTLAATRPWDDGVPGGVPLVYPRF